MGMELCEESALDTVSLTAFKSRVAMRKRMVLPLSLTRRIFPPAHVFPFCILSSSCCSSFCGSGAKACFMPGRPLQNGADKMGLSTGKGCRFSTLVPLYTFSTKKGMWISLFYPHPCAFFILRCVCGSQDPPRPQAASCFP